MHDKVMFVAPSLSDGRLCDVALRLGEGILDSFDVSGIALYIRDGGKVELRLPPWITCADEEQAETARAWLTERVADALARYLQGKRVTLHDRRLTVESALVSDGAVLLTLGEPASLSECDASDIFD